jgi:crotonobetainyl-CoA:carnitine CoA-transferase CaiB-like acyl-CoA transferase
MHTPTLGEQNSEILAELGFNAAEIEGLTEDGVIFAEELA